jgi:hypothetical protein
MPGKSNTIQKRSVPKLAAISKNKIIERILDGRVTVNDIYSPLLPSHLRDELIELYNFQIAVNGLRLDLITSRQVDELLQIDIANPFALSRMYSTIPESERDDLMKLHKFNNAINGRRTGAFSPQQANEILQINGQDPVALAQTYSCVPIFLRVEFGKLYTIEDEYRHGNISINELYQSIHVIGADRIAIDNVAASYQDSLNEQVFFYVIQKMEQMTEMQQLLHRFDLDLLTDAERQKYPTRNSIIIEAGETNAFVYNYYLNNMKTELDLWYLGDAKHLAEYLQSAGSMQSEHQILSRMIDIFEAASSRLELGVDLIYTL